MIEGQGTDLMARERDLEQRLMVGLGADRYYEKMLRQGEERSRPGVQLLRKVIPPLAEAVAQWVQDAKDGKAARAAGVALYAGQFEPTDIAYITARVCLSSFGQGHKLTSAAMTLTRTLEAATLSAALREKDVKAWKRLNTKAEKCPYPGKRYILVKKAMEKASVKRITWTISEKVRLGSTLIEMCAETSGLFDIVNIAEGKRTIAYIQARAETLEWLDMAHQRCSLQAPHYLPMVVPPRNWRTTTGGGYYDDGLPLYLIASVRRGLRARQGYEEELRHRDMPMVYDAINAIQGTPWRVNKGVLRVLKEVWESGSSLGKLPSSDKIPLPASPWADNPIPRDTEEGKAFLATLARTHEANEKLAHKRRAVIAKLYIAETYEQYERIYFPHVLDWRGRIYPVPPHVNPQSDDSGRALIEFADGVPLGDDGAYWLAVHGANCYGVDKVPFEERVQWVEEHQDAIFDAAVNPLNGTRFWVDAEDPYMFLAFCMEWAGLAMHVGNGGAQEDFVSHLPVSWDGSCNGLQNFSAMLRDPVGGAATNLVPQEYPADIYQRVADVASKQVTVDAANGEVNASYWLGKVTRKIAKRPTMTLPYGSGKYGFRDQLRAELQAYKIAHQENYLRGDEFLCSVYLANVLHDALGQVVVAARTAMEWLREASLVAAQEGLPVWWTTPAGFPVMQDYRQTIGKQIDFHASGQRYQLTVHIETDKLDKKKQAQGISPNFVHSLDAAHLMRTVVRCMPEGIKHFAMVHDSYGAHAGHATTLHRVLREAFVEQYSGNVLEDFRTELHEQVNEKLRSKLPSVPPMGDLDLTAVMQSAYFFA
jgi:DNA-directed RNA polymerase